MRVDGSCIRKEKVADSKISGYVWTGPKERRLEVRVGTRFNCRGTRLATFRLEYEDDYGYEF